MTTDRVDGRAPCIIGVARIQVGKDEGPSPEPLELWAEACTAAAADTGATAGIDVLARAQSLHVVKPSTWDYDDAAGRLAARLGIDPGDRGVFGISGSTPQKLVNRAGEAILRGDIDLGVIVGGEPKYTVRRMRLDGETPRWSHRDPDPPPNPWELSLHPSELAHGVGTVIRSMAMRDVARRAHLDVTPDDYAAGAGPTYAAMSAVAAANPFAWNRTPHTPAAIVDPSAPNFLVESYYTKFMVACPDVDQAGALIVAAAETADELGIPRDRRVYLRGWCTAEDPPFVAANPDLWRSPAMAAASAHAFELAGTTIDEVGHMDLYSCFPVAINFNRDALGLAADDPRPVTVTGGLPYAGAAASSYVVMSIAAMVDRLRSDPGAWGLVNGLGMQLASHSYALYCTEPGPLRPPEQAEVQARLDRAATVPIADEAEGPARLATFSTAFVRDGSPRDTVAICDLDGGRRCYARATDPSVVTALATGEHVGDRVALRRQPDGRTSLVDITP